MIYSLKWKNIIRGVSTFQIILCFILFHSLSSILIIYSHLSRYFSDEKIWKQTSENTKSLEDYIVWNLYTSRNVLSSKIISNEEISVNGWWMDHVKYDYEIRCFNLNRALCSTSFSTVCKIDGIRAVYQYVTFSKESSINGFDLHITATADQLESQATAATFGVVALVKLYDGSTENVQLQFPSNIEPLTSQSASFSSSSSTICSVTVMLMCYGYSGSVHFTDPVLIPHGNLNQISDCPHQCPKPVSSENKLRLENLQMPSNHSFQEQSHLVTLVTQVSMDRLSALERSLKLWYGPVSLVIYASSKHSEKSEYEWQRLYVQKKIKTLKLSPSSHVTLALGTTVDGNYPINLLRNIAVSQVRTKYMFLLDGDFEPAPDFQQKFSNSVKYYDHSSKNAFVVPAFEYIELPQKSDNAPQTKEELLQLLHREEPFILPFRITESSESHRNTDYWKWYRAAKPYILKAYCDKYEPYIVLQKSAGVPQYDERFFGYGMNKVMHITELFAANYTFVVLPDVWVLHLPHKISTYAVEFLQNFHQRLKNRMERFEFMVDIMYKYKILLCK